MDQELHLDFCFSVGAGLVLVAGWSPQSRPEIVLHAGPSVLKPVAVSRFARRDLRSLEPMGFLALFDLSKGSGAAVRPGELVFDPGGRQLPISSDRLAMDIARFTEIGVDETFFTYVRMVASGEIPLPPSPLSENVIDRLMSAPRLGRETIDFALSVDRGVIGPDGQGVCMGWFLAATRSASKMAALVVRDGTLFPVDLTQAGLPRPDLQGYAPRYAYDGRNGWAAAFRLPGNVTGQTHLVLLPAGQLAHSGYVHPLETVGPAEVARAILEIGQGLEDQSRARRLHRDALPKEVRPAPGFTSPAGADGPVLLVLDHDLNDVDLRDVLRKTAGGLNRPLMVHLLRPSLTHALEQALAGAARECAKPITLSQCALTPPAAGGHDGMVIFARSSLLFHLDPELLASPMAKPFRIVTIDPLASHPGSGGTAGLTRRFLAGRPSFLCMGNAVAMLAPVSRPGAFLTPEANWRDLCVQAVAQGQADIVVAPANGFLSGNGGPFSTALVHGVSWHDFDGRSAQLMTEAK